MWGLASITTCQLCVILFKNHQPVCIGTGILFIFTIYRYIEIYRISNEVSSVTDKLTQLVCETRLLSVQMHQACMHGPASLQSFTV